MRFSGTSSWATTSRGRVVTTPTSRSLPVTKKSREHGPWPLPGIQQLQFLGICVGLEVSTFVSRQSIDREQIVACQFFLDIYQCRNLTLKIESDLDLTVLGLSFFKAFVTETEASLGFDLSQICPAYFFVILSSTIEITFFKLGWGIFLKICSKYLELLTYQATVKMLCTWI